MAALCFVILLVLASLLQAQAECPGKADVIFAVPAGSPNVPGQEFFPFEQFLIQLTKYFSMGPKDINVGLILYGREPVAISWPQPFKDHVQTNTRITLMSERQQYSDRIHGGNNIAGAIMLMRHMFKNPSGYPLQGPRPGAEKIGVVFVYGKAPFATGKTVLKAAKSARADGVTLYAIGGGKTGPEFPKIASDTCKLFSMGSFIDGLPSVLPYLGSSLCTLMDPLVNATANSCFPDNLNFTEFWTPGPTPEVSCSPQGKAIFQDPTNCAYYYKCDQKLLQHERCPPGMLFEPLIKGCNYKEAVTCFTQISCPTRMGLFPHPTDCSKFVNCFGNIPYLQSCPRGLWFNPTEGVCDHPTKMNCPMA